MALHADELDVDTRLVRRLVQRSCPHLVRDVVVPLASSGSSNALFRLGDDLVVRLPRQPGGSAAVDKEIRWLPVVAGGVTARVPEVVATGEPGFGYPERWLVTRWIDGDAPDVPWDDARCGVGGSSAALAADLATFVAELGRLPVPAGAAADPALRWYRGGPLAAVDEEVRAALDACRQLPGLDLDAGRCLQVWRSALAADRRRARSTRWYHGDLLAENLLVRQGRLAAVLDFGALSVGDPAVDLMVAWEVLDRAGRERFRALLGVDDATWTAAKGWALAIAVITFPYYWRTMPGRCAARRSMLAAALRDEPSGPAGAVSGPDPRSGCPRP